MAANYTIGLSTGRTGTKYLAELFSHCGQKSINSVHESRYSRIFNIIGTMYRSGFISENFVRHTWKSLKTNHKSINEYDTYIDFNNHLYAIANIIQSEQNNLRLIHIVRDPRTYIRSHINWSTYRLKSYIANRLTPFWQPSGALIGQYTRTEWSRASRIEKYAWIWNYKNRLIESYKDMGIPYLFIRFEDLFASEILLRSNVEKMSSFIGIDMPSDINADKYMPVNSSKIYINEAYVPRYESEYVIVNKICGDLMQKYNYL